MYSSAPMGGGGDTMCVTASQLAGSRMWTFRMREASVFHIVGELLSWYISWTVLMASVNCSLFSRSLGNSCTHLTSHQLRDPSPSDPLS